MMLKFYSALFLIICSIGLKAQTLSAADLPKSIPPSPEAAALGKYGEVPVSLYIGLQQVSIPIYTLKYGSIGIDVNLSYYSGGIRVDDIATNVGLGWSLNAGGVISKTTLGLPDGINDYTFPGVNFNPHRPPTDNIDFAGVSYDYELAMDAVNNNRDLERDIYSYNFLGNSGKFTINRDGKVCLIPANPNIKIAPVNYYGSNSGFIITDDKGFKYTFDSGEGMSTSSVCSIGYESPREFTNSLTTGFFLSKIKSPDNREVTLEYENYNYTVLRSYNEVKYFSVNPSTECDDLTSQNRKCSKLEVISGVRVKRIYSDDNSTQLVFSYLTDRMDIPYNNVNQGKVLDDINLVANNVGIRNWHFNYGYFTNGTTSRLKLLSVKEDSKQPYQFYYNETNPLPDRLSFSQDHWGFYNGKINSTFIPSIPVLGFVTGADRSPDFQYSASSTLNRIKYPTGGFSDFEYEPHKDQVTENITTYSLYNESLTVNSGNTTNDTYSNPFYIPAGAAEIMLSWELSTINYDDQIYAHIVDANNTGIFYKTVNAGNASEALSSLPSNHSYRLMIQRNNTSDVGSINIQWKAPTTTNSTYDKIIYGGLRIKNIKNYESDGLLASQKSYNYNKQNDPLHSSAQLETQQLNYYSNYQKPNNVHQSPSWTPCEYYVLNSSSSGEFSNGLNSGIGYAEVTETEIGGSNNGRIHYSYSLGGYDVGANIVGNSDWAKGLLLEKRVDRFEPATLTYKPVTKTRNYYQAIYEHDCYPNPSICLPNQTVIPNLRISFIRPQYTDYSVTPNPPTYPAIFLVEKYFTSSAEIHLIKTQDITYNYNPQDSIISYKDYFYANTNYSNPTKIESLDSKGAIIKSEFKYPHDLALGQGANIYNTMVDRNIISPVIEQKVTDITHSVEIGKKITSYSYWDDNIIKPVSEQISFNMEPLHSDIQYHKYDVKGNIVSISKNNGPKICYLYSYNSQYPIAEIKNADYATIESLLGGANAVNNFSNQVNPDKAAVDAFLAPLKAGLPNAFISTYSYKPLVGMSSQTDAKGMTIYYEYDAFGRLQYVRDQNNNIVKSNTYHYKN